MKTLSDFKFKNKLVLLRADLNSDVHKGKLLLSERIKQSAVTINELKRKKAKIIVLAHQGRPGKKDFLSLKQHAEFLNKYTKIKFIPDTIGRRAVAAIKNLESGEAILLENVRFLKEELNPGENKFTDLSGLCDIYVNDAFSVCHRKQTSIVSFPKYLKSCAGRLLEREVKALKKIKVKNCLYMLGGAKPEDNIKLLGRNKVLTCGLFGQVCAIAKGKNLGAQNKYLKRNIKDYDKIIKQLKSKLRNNKQIQTPLDFAVKINSTRKELNLHEFPSRYEIFDIGKKTQELYAKEIKKAKAIYMKGPAGYCADKKFRKGTYELLKEISKNKGFSVIGGGHLSDAIEKLRINKKKFNHISLSGGSLLSYIAGEKLPGLEALK